MEAQRIVAPTPSREEKNQTEWAKERLTSLLVGLCPLDGTEASCKVTKVSSISGEVSLQSRKQRRFALYELDINLNWEGQIFDAEGKVAEETKGTARIEDLSEETIDDLPFELTCDNAAGRRQELKETMRTKGAEMIKAAALEWVKELKALVAAGADGSERKGPGEEHERARPPPIERVNNSYVVADKVSGGADSTVTVDYTFALNRTFVYESLIDANRMRAATAADAIIEPTEGGALRLFNGSVEGKFVELVCRERVLVAVWLFSPIDAPQVPGEKIVQKWRFSTWQPGHYSDVTITFKEDGGNTVLSLVQVGVPTDEKERTERGWRVMIFDRLKMVLGGVPP